MDRGRRSMVCFFRKMGKRVRWICAAAVFLSVTLLVAYFCKPDPLALSSRPNAVLHVGLISYADRGMDFDLESTQAFVYDLQTNEIVFSVGMEKIVYPASLTKLCTILYALTILEPSTLITPGEEVSLIASDSSIAYVKRQHTLTVEMLIEGMLLPSGNDAAYALAGAAGRVLADDPNLSGEAAIETFMEGMNRYADEIGCVGTHFTVPDGYFDEDHYTTMEDLILIASLAADNEIIAKYASLASDHVIYADGSQNDWINTNLMLDPQSEFYSPYVNGLKTGSVRGNYHLICSAKKDGASYLIGLLGADSKEGRFRDALKICNYLFEKSSNAG